MYVSNANTPCEHIYAYAWMHMRMCMCAWLCTCMRIYTRPTYNDDVAIYLFFGGAKLLAKSRQFRSL